MIEFLMMFMGIVGMSMKGIDLSSENDENIIKTIGDVIDIVKLSNSGSYRVYVKYTVDGVDYLNSTTNLFKDCSYMIGQKVLLSIEGTDRGHLVFLEGAFNG